jgi:hypothetical protein
MDVAPLLVDLYGRIPELAHGVVDGLDVDALIAQPAPGANHIAWLIWHTARVQDSYHAELTSTNQLWTDGDWAPRFGLAADPSNNGYGHTADEVAAVRPESNEVLISYLDAAHERMRTYLEQLSQADLDRVVDANWDPPVTLGVRLISIADDGVQHLGQAAYVRGLLQH